MNSVAPNLKIVIEACLKNGHRLVEDAELLLDFERHPTAVAVAVLAEEEFAKTFLLVLVSEGVVPWTLEVRRSLYSHECKHLIGVVVEWLGPPWEEQHRRLRAFVPGETAALIPHDVAVAINILRHEKIERMRTGYAFPNPEDDGLSRKIAEGLRDREKQRALYVGVAPTGWVESLPSKVTRGEAIAELERAKQYGAFAEDAFADRVLSFGEYQHFKEVVHAVFADLAGGASEA